MARNRGLSFYRRKKKISSALIREIFSWIFGILVSVFIAGVLVFLCGMSIHVAGVSMEPTLYNGQRILINRFVYAISSPKPGDVIVFLPNGNENAHYYVKRVVAASGDHVRIEDGVLYVNGLESEWPTEKILDGGIAENDLVIKNGQVFCLGDNPNNSEDSRSPNIGPVSEEHIVGKAWFGLAGEAGELGFIK